MRGYPELRFFRDKIVELLKDCTAYGFLDPSLKKARATITISLERSIQWPNAEDSRRSLKRNLFSKFSAVPVPKQKCVDVIISTKINSHSGSDTSLKVGPLFESTDKRSSDDEQRIAHLSQDIHEAREHIGHFITQVYHQKRPHWALGYLTPVEFQRQTFS